MFKIFVVILGCLLVTFLSSAPLNAHEVMPAHKAAKEARKAEEVRQEEKEKLEREKQAKAVQTKPKRRTPSSLYGRGRKIRR